MASWRSSQSCVVEPPPDVSLDHILLRALSVSSRFAPAAAELLRTAIREAGGVEVFAIGDCELGTVTSLLVTCRGLPDRVPALLERPRPGQVVIHNHPSGNLRPSDADLQLAQLYGENGVGVVIVDSAVSRSNWVVEPFVPQGRPIDEGQLRAFFEESLPRALPGWEARPQQLEMALAVARGLDEQRPVLCEAGTGTGKSLAYLVPAALWALANDGRVMVSTYTRTLQAQLVASDLPLLLAGGLQVKTAVLQGRTNYLCRRRLQLAVEGASPDDEPDVHALHAWSEGNLGASRGDLPFSVDASRWEGVQSESDLSLSIRCPHYNACHYYTARRNAAAAHVVVVNHALLLTDLAVREENGRGFLPTYHRIVLDEGHHLEDAATGASTERLTSFAVRRAVAPLLDTQRRKGALTRLVASLTKDEKVLPRAEHTSLIGAANAAAAAADHAANASVIALGQLAEEWLGTGDPVRITEAVADGERFRIDLTPLLTQAGSELNSAAEALDAIHDVLGERTVPEGEAQPVLDVDRARRRLAEHSVVVDSFLNRRSPTECRWLQVERERGGSRSAGVNIAPVEVSAVLAKILWAKHPGTVVTSATLTVAGKFDHLARRIGLPSEPEAVRLVLASPFDHEKQALLGLPRDLPGPDDPNFLAASGQAVVDAILAMDGGAFVLCTSYTAVRAYAAAVRAGAGDRPILVHGEGGRAALLDRFRENRRSVLIGTDSFWEGVSVRGDGLRLVIIPRIPFRVPTEPLLQARHEQIQKRGGDPFKAYSLPEAVLKLRQGYGRLIRSHTDRGVVLLLDRRVHDKAYGTIVLRSLPPARRVTGPWRMVLDAVRAFASEAVPPNSS